MKPTAQAGPTAFGRAAQRVPPLVLVRGDAGRSASPPSAPPTPLGALAVILALGSIVISSGGAILLAAWRH